MTFAPNSTAKAQTATRDGEPSSRVHLLGNYYVCGIRGVPAGVDLWIFDLRPTYRGRSQYGPSTRKCGCRSIAANPIRPVQPRGRMNCRPVPSVVVILTLL